MKNDFKTPQNNKSYYDLFEDYPLIEASFAQQYGIRLRNEEDMEWGEYMNLLSGLNDMTPLGRVVSIRSEKDPKRIKEFTPDQKKIRNEWLRRQAKNMSREEYDKAMAQLELAFKNMSKNN